MSTKEASARIKINNLLQDSGWRFFDTDEGQANIQLEPNVKLTTDKLDDLGEDFEKTHNGFVDYLLLDNKGFPIVVLEAKKSGKNPLDGKEQARRYALSQGSRFVILSNGDLHYFWDLEQGNPEVISQFPSQSSLAEHKKFKPDPKKLSEIEINEDYVVLTQYPDYKKDPRWSDENLRHSLIDDRKLKFLRPYQVKAVQALQKAARNDKTRYLFEMATGTGKTLTTAAVIRLFLKSGNAKRVLFLVDRIELEEQAEKSFTEILKNDFVSVIFKRNRDDWRKAEIVVSTVQTLASNNKYRDFFSPTDFDLIISDEAHRSISGNSRAVFEYFVGYKLGLTATPKDYLKNLDKEEINDKDQRSWERRQLLDTYKTFGCESGDPTYRYSLVDGVKDGYLINPVVVDARTEITTQLLSDKGYSVIVEGDDGVEEVQTYFQTDFERKFYNEKTNYIFCKTFIENALRDPISGEIGKSIVFAVSQPHASKITQILNQFADQMFPGKYNSDFAVQVTSNIKDAQTFTTNFTNNNLNGHTKFIEGYKSSKTRVCVTVGMMTTGYDCPDLLNLAMLRPIFSPTDFVQIKGRGTRKNSFKYRQAEYGEKEIVEVEKEQFKLFDFFANCEYFEDKFNYDEVLKLPIENSGGKTGGPGAMPEEIDLAKLDPLKTMSETQVGVEGMKVDWKLYEKFEQAIQADPQVKHLYENISPEAAEDYVRSEKFDKPDDYFNLDKLRKSIKSDRRVSLREMIDKAFGNIPKFKSKDELLDEEFEKFVTIEKPDNDHLQVTKHYFKAYVTDPEIREIVESKEFARLHTNPKLTFEEFKALNGYREKVPEYVKDYVSINSFME
ncbi:restriction endonuclease subunit R [Candidatus Saccharibacteria bacterium CPR2]|nr:restriction endonuclease subunit R [Candidatus Saccharibacteria bacterium CPR2]